MSDAWRDLLPYMDRDELHELLGERGAWELHQRGASTGDREAVAAVLADLLGHPSDVIEGEPIR